jgi:hypothetical protein
MQMSYHQCFKGASYFVFTTVILLILLTFKQYGVSNDEEVQRIYGELLLNFYASGFRNLSVFQYKNLYLYGGFFDLTSALLQKILPLWLWDVRHLLSAVFGFSGLVAVYKTTRFVSGPRAAFFALILLSLAGAWIGAMFTHTKDISFATCMAWSLYYTVRISKALPTIPLGLSLKLGVAVGCALGLRIGGAFAVISLCLMVLLTGVFHAGSYKEKLHFFKRTILGLIPAGFVAFVLMAIFWPWSVMGWGNIFLAVKSFSHFVFNMNTIVDGEVLNIGLVPSTYLFEYLGVRLHELFLFGLLCAFVFSLLKIKPTLSNKNTFHQAMPMIAVSIALFVPVFFVLLDRPALYNGVRHFTFIIPTLAIVAGIGLSYLFQWMKPFKRLHVVMALFCVGLSLNTLNTLRQLQPYEYLYYNQFAGDNFKEAIDDWEGDYWSSSLIDAAKVLKRFVYREEKDSKIDHIYQVAVCAEPFQMQAYLNKHFKVTTDWVAADFFISSNNMDCDDVLKGQVIGTIERLGATLATIKDRRQLVGKARLPRPALPQ